MMCIFIGTTIFLPCRKASMCSTMKYRKFSQKSRDAQLKKKKKEKKKSINYIGSQLSIRKAKLRSSNL